MDKAINIIAGTYQKMISPERCVILNCCDAVCMDMQEIRVILEKNFKIKTDSRWCFADHGIVCKLRDEKLKEYICKDMNGVERDKIEYCLLGREFGENTSEDEDENDEKEVLYDCFFMKTVNCRKDIIVSKRRAIENTLLFCKGYSHLLLDEVYGRYKAFLNVLYEDIDREDAKKKFEILLNSIRQLDTGLKEIWNGKKIFCGELWEQASAYERDKKDNNLENHCILAGIINERVDSLYIKIRENKMDYLDMVDMGIKRKVGMLLEHILRFGNYYKFNSAEGFGSLESLRQRFPYNFNNYRAIGYLLEDTINNNLNTNKLKKYCEELEKRVGDRSKFYFEQAG